MVIKQLRKDIDKLALDVEGLLMRSHDAEMTETQFKNIKEEDRCLEIARTKLQEAKMWCGKVLEARGSLLPKDLRDYSDKREETCDTPNPVTKSE